MADTVRTRGQLQSAFADNITQAIVAQNGRDLVVSAFGFIGAASPTANNDGVDTAGIGAFFDVGSMWLDTTNGTVWICKDGSTGAAVWFKLYPSAGGMLTGIARSSQTAFNVGTGLTDLWSVSVPGGTLATLNDELRWEAHGNFASDLNTKFIVVVWGGSTLLNQSTSGTGNTKWLARGRIIRTGATTQKTFAKLVIQAPSVNYSVLISTAAETLSGAVNFKVQGSSASGSNEVSFVAGYVDKAAA